MSASAHTETGWMAGGQGARAVLPVLLAAGLVGACGSSGGDDGEGDSGAGDGGAGDSDGGGEDAGGGEDGGVLPAACMPGGAPSHEEAWDCLEAAACRLRSRCLAPEEPDDCRAQLSLHGEPDRRAIERLRDGVAAGVVVYHGDRVAACVAGIDELACAAFAQSSTPLLEPCPIFTGTVPDGGDCRHPVECASPGAVCAGGAACDTDDPCCAHRCIAPAPDGGDCSGDAPCAPGSHCVDGACRTGEAGSPCAIGSPLDCDVDHWCDGGTCSADARPGARCTADEECPPPETCLGDDLAGSPAGTCGRSDRAGDGCDGFCFGLACEQPDDGALGACVPYAAGGESCAAIPCRPAFTCDDRRLCAPRGEAGDPCTASIPDCRDALLCDTEIRGAPGGQCVPPQEDGDACAAGDDCESTLCDPILLECEAFPDCYL
jgi:hypothetical protein